MLEKESTFKRSLHDKQNPYVQISRSMLHDRNLSLKSKGLLCYLLSLPDNWKIYHSQLMSALNCGEYSLSSAIDELLEKGYAKRERVRLKNGIYTPYHYEISESKIFLPNVFSQPGFPSPGNPDLINKDILKKEEITIEPAAPVVVLSSKKKKTHSDAVLPENFEKFNALNEEVNEEYQCKQLALNLCDLSPKVYAEFMKLSLQQIESGIKAFEQQNKTKQLSKGALITAIREGWKPNISIKEQEQEQKKKTIDVSVANKNKIIKIIKENEHKFTDEHFISIHDHYIGIKYGKSYTPIAFSSENCVQNTKDFIINFLNERKNLHE